jgi:hypothetical protein
MAEREIIWTVTAEKQLDNILEYWFNKNLSVEYPNRILRLVDEYIEIINNSPDSFRLTEYANHRVCVMGVFSIYFKRIDNLIYITCFWDNRQSPKRLKRILKRKNDT